ncbi:MAG: membrane protein [Saprospiraceae bacterium]|nr:MAG: membrane protein [Saprospiraceae bacterium]
MAQKYGHLNFGNLLSMMPETKAADVTLEAYRKQLITKGEEMATKFRTNYEKFVTDIKDKSLTPKVQEAREAALGQEQQSIMAYEQEISQKLQAKRQELLKPIVEKAEKAISDLGKEKGYQFIFDTSTFNAVLFVRDSDDVTPLIKAKLGIK